MWTSISHQNETERSKTTAGTPSEPLLPTATLGVADLACRYGVADATVRGWLRSEALKGRRIGRAWLVSWKALFAFEGGSVPGRSPRQRALAAAPLMTPEEVADLCSCSADTVLRWRREGRLTGLVVGGHIVRFRRDLLQNALGPSVLVPLPSGAPRTAEHPSKTTDRGARKTTSR
ncbi:helix-turn-helix domain-containing protein [Salinarimonas ramus]